MRILPSPTTYQHCCSFSSSSSSSSSSSPSSFSFLRPSLKSHLLLLRRWTPMALKIQKDNVILVMGATGTGKSTLSIDLSTRFPSEIINSDKMQVYKGLDITTNKITVPDRRNVPHHLLGSFDPENGEFSPSDFRSIGGSAISDINSRGNLPLVVGGSNSFIHALIVENFNPDADVFTGLNSKPTPNPVNAISTDFRYNCCFIWVDVSFPVLCDYLGKRVDDMLDLGMFDELVEFHDSGRWKSQPGLRKAIGVPEFDPYFNQYRYSQGRDGDKEWCRLRRLKYEAAVKEIKENTYELAKKQMGRIERLRLAGWDLQRVDATEAFRETMMMTSVENHSKNRVKSNKQKKKRWFDIWEREVLQPSLNIVKTFLEANG